MLTTHRPSKLSRIALVAIGLFTAGQTASAQSFRAPSTLRYGSGLFNVPVASVLPHMTLTGTYSGFTASIPEFLIVDPEGDFIAVGSPYEKWLSDATVAVGLLDLIEIGASLQHVAAVEDGGNMFGAFARVSLLPSSVEGVDLAVGARYVNSPTFGPNYAYDFQPNRLGYPDSRLHRDVGDEEYSANLTPYAVGSAYLPMGDAAEISVTLGWGSGLFAAGGDLDFHQDGSTGGVFGGAGIHFGVGSNSQISLLAEHDGFDVNAGAQADFGFVRAGVFALGATHNGYSTFRSRKLGVMAALALPTVKPDTVITPYTVTLADTTITPRRIITADTTVVGRELPDADRAALTQTVFFDFDQSEIRDDMMDVMRGKVAAMDANPGVEVGVEGHADELGPESYNEELGLARAVAVQRFLMEAGISAVRMTTVSRGETMPLVEGGTAAARAQNRRVEFVITAETSPETVITADTTMVADTTITTREEMRADTVITPSRWGHSGAADDQGEGAVLTEPYDLLAELFGDDRPAARAVRSRAQD